ncbi:uncharacterized protein METZ01_LOCUS208523 [marine metagenome]|uniref:Uncharacterized protein n=1 Tax=marine metagenome TaxID=408172 RepID=A0A382EZ16_9ZZZZ
MSLKISSKPRIQGTRKTSSAAIAITITKSYFLKPVYYIA